LDQPIIVALDIYMLEIHGAVADLKGKPFLAARRRGTRQKSGADA
jgi:hypothetical protein